MPCLTPEQIEKLARSELEPDKTAELRAHIEQCDTCRVKLDECVANEQHLREVKEDLGSAVPPASEPVGSTDVDARSKIGQHIGSYRVVEVLGQGGMGVVYLAEQDHPRRSVALKLIRPGIAKQGLLRRFEHEAEILGRLQHPGIAQIYEAGVHRLETGATTTTPQPFFAMERVEGLPLSEYAATHKLGVRARLELFTKVCAAVEHAHQKGVIHRDLKPGNILVTEDGQPKVLDFGVARATDADIQTTTLQTDIGQLLGTIPYMSPEQAAGDPDELDTRSDVYALGVVLYELLAGCLPHDLARKMIHEAVRIIREDDPMPLRSVNRVLHGDVETIVAKALEKDKSRRYQSASDLASDIGRYLADEPIVARPASAMYQFRKFAKRNKTLVGGVAAVFVVLVAGIVGTSIGLARALAAEELARQRLEEAVAARGEAETRRAAEERQRKKAEAITEFVTKALVSSDPHEGGAQGFPVTAAMEQAIELLDAGELKDQPETEAALRLTISEILNGNARSEQALGLAERALEINKKLHPGDHPDVAWSLGSVANCLDSLGRCAEALPRHEAALEMCQRLFQGDHRDVAASLDAVGACLDYLDRSAEALPKHEAALEMFQRLFPGDHPDVAMSLITVAECLQSLGRSVEALPEYEAALEMFQRLFQGDHPNVAASLGGVAFCLQSLGRSVEALPKYEAALEMYQRLFRGDHPAVAHSLNNVALCLNSLGRSAETLPKYEAALEMRKRLFPGNHPDVAQSLNNVGACLNSLSRSSEALPRFEAALEMYQRLFRDDHSIVALSMNNVAVCLDSLDRSAEALPKHEAALEMCRRLFPGDHPNVALGLNSVAACLRSLGRSVEALPKYEAALEMCRRLFPGDHPNVALGLNNLATCLHSLGRSPEALPKYEAALEMHRRVLPAGHPNTLYPQIGLARTLVALGRYTDAETLLRDASAQCDHSEASRRLHRRSVLKKFVQLYDAWHAAEPDEGYDAKAAEWREKLEQWQATTQPATQPGTQPSTRPSSGPAARTTADPTEQSKAAESDED